MMAGSNRDRVADAIREGLVSANVAGGNCEPANVKVRRVGGDTKGQAVA
jgi:hypothetical protein